MENLSIDSHTKRLKLLLECARLFYEKGLTKSQIAEKLGFSGMHIGRLLEEAQKLEIVSYKIIPPRLVELEQRLIEKFHLKDAKVVISGNGVFSANIAKIGANYLDKLTSSGIKKVAIGGGEILYRLVDSIESNPQKKLIIAPLAIIPRGPEITYVDANFLVSLLLKKSSPKSLAYSFGIPSPRQNLKSVAEKVLKVSQDADILIASTGCIRRDSTTLKVLEQYSDIKYQDVKNLGAIGHVNYQLYDKNGNVNEKLAVGYLIKLSKFKEFSRSPNKYVIILSGCKKIEPVLCAAKSGFMNVLITDEQTAVKLLD